MALTVGTRNIADIRVQDVALEAYLGSYNMAFILHADIRPIEPSERICAQITSADVSIRAGDNAAKKLGCARPNMPFVIEPGRPPSAASPVFSLLLLPQQIAAIEDQREGGDVSVELIAAGRAETAPYSQMIQDSWRIEIPRSKWLKMLKGAGIKDTLLLEIPIPGGVVPEHWKDAADFLRSAQEYFQSGDYAACIATCRQVVEEVGALESGKKNWAGEALADLHSGRTAMTQEQRLLSILAAIRHYTHLAHHSGGEGGAPSFSRSDAKFVLALTANLMLRAR